MNAPRIAIVTGASRGIGAAIAQRLARDGATVVVNYSGSADDAAKVVNAVVSSGGNAVAIRADVSKPADVRALFEEVERRFGGGFVPAAESDYESALQMVRSSTGAAAGN